MMSISSCKANAIKLARISVPQPMMSISSCKANAIKLARIAEPQPMMSIKVQVFYLARGNALGKIEHGCDAL